MAYDVTIKRQGLSALFDLKGVADQVAAWTGPHLPKLPTTPNSCAATDDSALYCIGLDHWLVRAPIAQEDSLCAALKPENCPPDISIVRVSDTLVFFEITGPDAGEVMAVACPLDLHPSVFGVDKVTYTEAFGLKALVRRVEGGFEFAVEQSFGNMVTDYLARTTA
ncbi:MAG: sarcosine oxidase subunit gamma family protein [Pseudomonadota bacterium]